MSAEGDEQRLRALIDSCLEAPAHLPLVAELDQVVAFAINGRLHQLIVFRALLDSSASKHGGILPTAAAFAAEEVLYNVVDDAYVAGFAAGRGLDEDAAGTWKAAMDGERFYDGRRIPLVRAYEEDIVGGAKGLIDAARTVQVEIETEVASIWRAVEELGSDLRLDVANLLRSTFPWLDDLRRELVREEPRHAIVAEWRRRLADIAGTGGGTHN